jgi:uncharacterized protein YfeS
MYTYSNIWDVTPETAHPRARELLSGTNVWNYGDSDSPLGNDTGADAFASYLIFRSSHPSSEVQDFVSEELASLEVSNSDWDVIDDMELRKALIADQGYSILTRDDFIVGVAFAQLLIDGEVDAGVRARAITALRREATDTVLSFRAVSGISERKRQLEQLLSILSHVYQ